MCVAPDPSSSKAWLHSRPLGAIDFTEEGHGDVRSVGGYHGGALSWFASTHPDGLEWSIEKVTGKGELQEAEHGIARVLKGIQEKMAFLPDYGFKPAGNESKKEERRLPGLESKQAPPRPASSALRSFSASSCSSVWGS